mmetsp:Transcript_11629/g.32790  ORF Transcript_11629/g.32790 Transcript_11629/m.32790 type:complete len:506 (-) Transcript_11629:16-1533(-)
MALCFALVFLSLASAVTLHDTRGGAQQLEEANSTAMTLSGRTPFRQVLHNYLQQDMQYFADVLVGNQSLQGILDTGSFEMLVFSDTCHVCGDPELLYMDRRSPTFQRGYLRSTHFFGSGSTLSTEGFEHVAVGPLAAPRISFWEVYDADMPVLEHSEFQAIVGVGPPGNPESSAWEIVKEEQNRLETWKNRTAEWPAPMRRSRVERLSRLVNESVEAALYSSTRNDSLLEALHVESFSVCLGSAVGSDGYFIWHDDMPLQNSNLFMNTPVSGEHTWGVRLTGVHLGDSDGLRSSNVNAIACDHGCGAIVDSGTSLLVMPRAAARRITAALQAANAACDAQLGVSGLPYLHLQLGDHRLSLPPEAYIGTVIGTPPSSMTRWLGNFRERVIVCGLQLAVMTQDAETQLGPLWILGMPFFRQYYVNFDLGSGGRPRSINMALAGQGCHPAGNTSTALLSEQRTARSIDAAGESAPMMPERRRFRSIDASTIRVPRWATRAFARGLVRI